MKLIIIILFIIVTSCNKPSKITQEYPNTFIKYDTINYGDERFHDDIGAWIFGITKKGDTLRVKWIDKH